MGIVPIFLFLCTAFPSDRATAPAVGSPSDPVGAGLVVTWYRNFYRWQYFLLALGELFTLVVYGQLILENARLYAIDDDTVDQIFDFMVRDFSKYAPVTAPPSADVAT